MVKNKVIFITGGAGFIANSLIKHYINDNKIIVGDNIKLKTATGWYQTYSLEQSIEDIIAYFMEYEK